MTKVTLLLQGGVSEIGGNKFLVNDLKNSIKFYLDFGKNFNISRKYYEFPFTYPENITELISIGAVPADHNLYTRFSKEDFKKGININDERDAGVDAVFVSHAHLDHYGHISLLNRRIPIYIGDCALNIINASNSLIYYRTSPELVYDYLRFITFRTRKTINLQKGNGEINVKPIHVDHSIPGAYGFIIHTSAGTIAYTGDFRKHGPQKDMTEDFIRELEKEEIKALLIEGTHIHYSSSLSEKDVFNKILEVVEATRNKLVIIDFSRSDLDRFRTVFNVAKKTNRSLVIDAKRYTILKAILNSEGIRASDIDLDSPNILILDEGKKRLSEGEKKVFNEISENKIIKFNEMKKDPEAFIFTVVFGGIREIKALKPPQGSIFILSSSEPVNEEREISFDKLLNWLEHFGIASYHIHSSGHATPLDIRELIERGDPQIIIPIHTERPKLFRNFIGTRNVKGWFLPSGGEAKLDLS